MLTVYRRHLRTCKSGHKEELRTSEFDERKKGWKRCDCPIFASGTLAGKSQRRNTGAWEWEPAKTVAARWEKLGTWNGKKPELPRAAPEPTTLSDRISIHDATESFLAACQNRSIAVPTLKKYKTFVKQLKAYCDIRGYLMLDQLTVSDMDRFYTSWKDDKRAKAKKLERLKAFVKFSIDPSRAFVATTAGLFSLGGSGQSAGLDEPGMAVGGNGVVNATAVQISAVNHAVMYATTAFPNNLLYTSLSPAALSLLTNPKLTGFGNVTPDASPPGKVA